MKPAVALILTLLLAFASATALPSPVHGEMSVGVKKGDWIEYTINMTGPPLDVGRNLTWYRIDVLEVNGAAFQVNKTALSVDGAFSSSIWNFNLSSGQVYGGVIIPANLSAGNVFFDASKSTNITIEGQEQKTLLDASRTVTHATVPGLVYKEWDWATGVYVYSVDHTTNYNVTINAVATNMWSPQVLREPPVTPYLLVAATITLVAVMGFLVAIIRRKS